MGKRGPKPGGPSNNPAGGPLKSRPWSAEVRSVVAQNPEKLRRAAQRLLDDAADGDKVALKELRETLEGKAPQAILVSGDEEGKPLKMDMDVSPSDAYLAMLGHKKK